MLSISSGNALARALTMPLPDGIRDLLLLRRDQLGGEFAGHCRFVVFRPRDTLSSLEETLGFDVFVNAGDGTRHGHDPDHSPGFDLCVDHGGFLRAHVRIHDRLHPRPDRGRHGRRPSPAAGRTLGFQIIRFHVLAGIRFFHLELIHSDHNDSSPRGCSLTCG